MFTMKTNQIFEEDHSIFRGLCKLRSQSSAQVYRDILSLTISNLDFSDTNLHKVAKAKGCLDELDTLKEWYKKIIEEQKAAEVLAMKKYRKRPRSRL